MTSYNFDAETFDENEYLFANPDVAQAVKKGIFKSAFEHFSTFGKNENRKMRPSPPSDREVLRHYIFGNGIEIGALHNPLDISGLPVTNISYVDRSTADGLRKEYPDLINANLVKVDIIDNGEVLGKIKNEALDFIIANHLIEHTHDPIGTITNWLSKLRRDGIIFMAVPDKRFTFDVKRELTPLQHLAMDYRTTPQSRLVQDKGHYIEWATLVEGTPADKIESRINHLIKTEYPIHFHTFTLQSFLDMLNYLRQEYKLPFVTKACADISRGSNEFVIILMRTE